MQLIDIKSIIKSKTNKKIPNFVVAIIEKILCLKRVNGIILKYGCDNQGVDFANRVLEELNITTSILGLENIPENEQLIFTSNHPLGALEALAIAKYLGQKFGNEHIKFITNEILSYIEPLKNIFTPVTVGANKQNKEKIENIEKLFMSDNQIIMFPSGTVARKIKGTVQDSEWKKMFIAKARQYRRNIVPVHCSGRCSNFFLYFSNFRKFLGIKINIEQIFFPREMFKQKNSTINIKIGKSISYKTFTTDKTDFEYAQQIRKKVYEI